MPFSYRIVDQSPAPANGKKAETKVTLCLDRENFGLGHSHVRFTLPPGVELEDTRAMDKHFQQIRCENLGACTCRTHKKDRYESAYRHIRWLVNRTDKLRPTPA